MFKNIVYAWKQDEIPTRMLARKVAKAHAWSDEVAEKMTAIVGPSEAKKMVEMAVAWRTGQIPDTSPEVMREIFDGQRRVALKLGMSEGEFLRVFERIYSKRLKNPANAYHMIQSMAYASPTYGPFLEAIPGAKCMLFTHGIAPRLDGKFGRFNLNRLGGNVELNDPCIVWCERDVGCRFDRDRGELLLDGILSEARFSEREISIFVYGAGYLTEMFCAEAGRESWLDELAESGAKVRIYACDKDETIDLRQMCYWFGRSFAFEKADGRELYWFGEQNQIELEWFRCDIMTMREQLKARGVFPDIVIAKGVMSYNIVATEGRVNAIQVVSKTCAELRLGGSMRFDLQLKHIVNLRNGLSFGWGFPVERSMKPEPGGITLLTESEFWDWMEQLKAALGLEDGLEIQTVFIRDDAGPMTAIVRVTRKR